MKKLLIGLVLGAFWTLTQAANGMGSCAEPVIDAVVVPRLACALSLAGGAVAASRSPQLLAADANCPSNCDSRLDVCLREAKTDALRDKCKLYFKGCLKTCSQSK